MAGSKYFSILFKDIEKNSQKILIKYCGLSKQYKKILWLRYVEDKTIYEISNELGYTKESTYNLLHKARKDIEEKLYKQYDLYPEEVQTIIDTIR